MKGHSLKRFTEPNVRKKSGGAWLNLGLLQVSRISGLQRADLVDVMN